VDCLSTVWSAHGDFTRAPRKTVGETWLDRLPSGKNFSGQILQRGSTHRAIRFHIKGNGNAQKIFWRKNRRRRNNSRVLAAGE